MSPRTPTTTTPAGTAVTAAGPTRTVRAVTAGGLAAAALVGMTALSGCASSASHDPAHASATVVVPADADYNAADIAFAAMMVPHHAQAVEMADLVLDDPTLDPQVVALATQIKAAQQPEIDTMTAWLETWGSPNDGSSGHAMGEGMMTADDLAALEAATVVEAGRLFLAQMIEHHEGAIAMAQAHLAAGKNPEAVSLAQQIIDTQQAEITTMQALLRG